MDEVKASIVRGSKDEKRENGILLILSNDKTISEDIIVESMKQYLSYNTVRILSPIFVTGVDIFKVTDDLFNKLDVMKYLRSDNKNIQSLFVNIIFAEVGKIISTTEVVKQSSFTDEQIRTIHGEINDFVRSAASAVKK